MIESLAVTKTLVGKLFHMVMLPVVIVEVSTIIAAIFIAIIYQRRLPVDIQCFMLLLLNLGGIGSIL